MQLLTLCSHRHSPYIWGDTIETYAVVTKFDLSAGACHSVVMENMRVYVSAFVRRSGLISYVACCLKITICIADERNNANQSNVQDWCTIWKTFWPHGHYETLTYKSFCAVNLTCVFAVSVFLISCIPWAKRTVTKFLRKCIAYFSLKNCLFSTGKRWKTALQFSKPSCRLHDLMTELLSYETLKQFWNAWLRPTAMCSLLNVCMGQSFQED